MSLLKEAIADAKSVKQLAMANAKAAIEETFRPTVQRLVSAKLAEEDELEGSEDELDIDLNFGGGEDEAPVEGGEDDMGFDSFTGDDETPVEDEEDVELESLLRELEGEDEEMIESDDVEMDAELSEEDEIELEEGEDEIPTGDEEDVYESILREFEDEMVEESEDGGAFDETPPTAQLNTENRKLRAELKKVKNQLREALLATAYQKRTLNEVNLLNAKLMYNVKVGRQYNLSDKQKTNVLESLDRANSVREVKLVYATICESLNKSTNLKRTSLKEGSASKPTPTIKRQAVTESFVPRWQELAGIVKK